ncbi:MAG: hypothetical protein RLZZ347_234 [Candidatus Parcubacteria bacterium]|jgi:superfamily II DNA or RNA helicase
MSTQPIEDRVYQQNAVRVILKWFRSYRSALMVMATGLGKMITAALITKRMRGPGIFLVHDNGILDHAMEEFRRVYGPEYTFRRFTGREQMTGKVDILFATLQMMRNHLENFTPDSFSWMVVDESHHAPAETYRQVIDWFNCRKLAITATPDRRDLLDIREIFGEEVVNIPLEEAIAQGWLPPIEYHLMTDNLDDEILTRLSRRVLEEGERVSVKEINSKVFVASRDREVAKIIKRYGKKAIVFCRNIDHANYFRTFLGSTADTYHSGHNRVKNQAVLIGLKQGHLRQVLAVNAFNEGIHVPDVDVVVFYRDTKSSAVFRQQLGRGLHPGAKKLIVLDFVGNVQRVMMIKKLADAVVERTRQKYPQGYTRRSFHIRGKGFNFLFSDQAIDLLKIMERVDAEFYPTWQEASKAVIKLGFRVMIEYVRGFRKDPRLPSNPKDVYKDYPGDPTFFGRSRNVHYKTWQEAGKAAIALGIKVAQDYRKKKDGDSLLPSAPDKVYKDFPGWQIFLGRVKRVPYPTLAMAKRALKRMRIHSSTEYQKRYRENDRLHAAPNEFYADEWMGWRDFCGTSFYPTLTEASNAAIRLGIKTGPDYQARYKEDPRLPSVPPSAYKDSWYKDGWDWYKFLGKK